MTSNVNIDLSTLNEPQRKAVEHIDGPTLVLAGAGSGKTRALTHKIAYLVSRGMKPWRILAVTFTNKAAREMAVRVEKLLNIPVEGLWIGTFHGICVRILRREAQRWGFRRDFTIYDRDDQLSALKKAMGKIGIKKDRLNPKHALNIIGRSKNDLVHWEKLGKRLSGPNAEIIPEIYRLYEELLKSAGAFDFDDLLVRPVEMFREDPDSLDKWQKKFGHILVDEFQDTNRTQYILMKLLCGKSDKITVVGDDDQSIYSWRGANIGNILGFEKDFKGVKTFRLEQNYRSTATILKAANAVVSHNKSRMPKKLWTESPDGPAVKILECWNEQDEAVIVVDTLESEKEEHGCGLKDFVILYRTNAQSRLFEDVLRRRGIRYVIVGGLRFYERREIKDILAYLRIIANPGDVVSFTRAVTTPKRGIGAKTIEKLEQFAAMKGISILDALGKAEAIFGSGVVQKHLKEFHNMLMSVSGKRGKTKLNILCHTIVEAIEYEKYLENEYPENFEDRINNVKELITAMGEFENITGEDDLTSFLAEVSLVADVDTWDENADTVTLMTLHSAKGLEFPSVFIAGVERGLFPLPNTFDSESELELEEERRLFYVGITRAEERLHISYAASRARYGSFSGGASMFIDELPGDVLEFESAEQYQMTAAPVRKRPVKREIEFEDYSQETPGFDGDGMFRVGSYIRHPKFGRGQIKKRYGTGEDIILTVNFGARIKKIMPNYVKIVPA